MEAIYKELSKMANRIRKDIVEMIYKSGDGHAGPSLSCADIITALYFNIMRVNPGNPEYEERDRLILSKGHACPALYSALAEKGYFPREELARLRTLGSILQGHPDMKKTPGIDMTSGSLGNGLSIGLGMAIAGKILNKDYYTYVITGDGETEEGVLWEAVMSAKKHAASKLVVFVDNNGMQSGGHIDEVGGLDRIADKWNSFGWYCQEIDGHRFDEIISAVNNAKGQSERPSVIICKTVKGKGVPFMENNNRWHKAVISESEYKEAIGYLYEQN